MASFDLNKHLESVYASFPEGKRKPIIGITANFRQGEATMTQAYYQQVVEAGGTPVLIPPVADKDVERIAREHHSTDMKHRASVNVVVEGLHRHRIFSSVKQSEEGGTVEKCHINTTRIITVGSDVTIPCCAQGRATGEVEKRTVILHFAQPYQCRGVFITY